MKIVQFECQECKRKISVQQDIFDKAYRGEKYCLSCRPKAKAKAKGRIGPGQLNITWFTGKLQEGNQLAYDDSIQLSRHESRFLFKALQEYRRTGGNG
ncbi:hypothetical protein SAMN05421790_10254 [Kroppenstedtia eburnea]|uniref:Uncharacterized protein n=1 Tax=Kroppenstedtia eburnea TaxID=714067 RepID=A0A1N7JGD5_9BACL|nr:hypothetical protein SAMN05421790_10254 [Kroppenstedtia eburnea]